MAVSNRGTRIISFGSVLTALSSWAPRHLRPKDPATLSVLQNADSRMRRFPRNEDARPLIVSYRLAGGTIPFIRRYTTIWP